MCMCSSVSISVYQDICACPVNTSMQWYMVEFVDTNNNYIKTVCWKQTQVDIYRVKVEVWQYYSLSHNYEGGFYTKVGFICRWVFMTLFPDRIVHVPKLKSVKIWTLSIYIWSYISQAFSWFRSKLLLNNTFVVFF